MADSPPASTLSKRTQKALLAMLDRSDSSVFSPTEFNKLIRTGVEAGELPARTTVKGALDHLQRSGALTTVRLVPPARTEGAPLAVTRFVRGPVSLFEVGLSLRPKAYLSHASAVFLHGLSQQIPKTIYVNKEQSPKPVPSTPLTQEGLQRAFANAQRSSNYVLTYEGYKFVLLSGKSTERLEVSEMKGPQGESLDVTRIERTLIDITVRPAYAGGVFEVLEVFRAAKDRISINTLIATLKGLSYVYPYHQAIGFYLARAGCDPSKLERLKTLGMQFDFYLSHRMGPTSYSPEWRLFFPEGM